MFRRKVVGKKWKYNWACSKRNLYLHYLVLVHAWSRIWNAMNKFVWCWRIYLEERRKRKVVCRELTPLLLTPIWESSHCDKLVLEILWWNKKKIKSRDGVVLIEKIGCMQIHGYKLDSRRKMHCPKDRDFLTFGVSCHFSHSQYHKWQ